MRSSVVAARKKSRSTTGRVHPGSVQAVDPPDISRCHQSRVRNHHRRQLVGIDDGSDRAVDADDDNELGVEVVSAAAK